MAHIGFGRWLGNPEPFPDYKYMAKLDQIDWLHWFVSNNIDMSGLMDGYGWATPPPPPPPDPTTPPGYSDTTARNVLIIYAQHEISLEDPLAPGEYNDTATAQYLSHYKWLGLSKAEWIAAGFDNPDDVYDKPPLAVFAELFWGDSHPFNVVHVGLDTNTDTITPYIVPASQHPNGYFVSITPKASGLPANEAGWELNSTDDNNRFQQLLIDIARSGYLDTYLDTETNYCKNIDGKIDFVILATPQLYKHDYYWNDRPGGLATTATLYPAVEIAGTSINRIFWQPGGWPNAAIHLHEYMHNAYQMWNWAGSTEYPTTPELFADKTGGGDPIKIPMTIPDVYARQQPYPSAPWRNEPCRPCLHRSYRPVMHPLMAASFGLTTLNRWATSSGNYNIGNSNDAWDFLCLQSPYDNTQFMILSAFWPPEVDGTTDYPYGGDEVPYHLKKGVYATIVKFREQTNFTKTYHTYSNIKNPVTNYMIETMTEQYQYGDIGLQDSRYNYTDVGKTNPLVNAKAVLLDHAHPITNPSGLTTLNNPFGVTVEWVGWTEISGVKTAQVTITIDSV